MEINDQMKNSKNLTGETIKVWVSDMKKNEAIFIGSYPKVTASSLVDDGVAYLETTEDVCFY